MQMKLFPQTIKKACLVAASPKQAFYNIWIDEINGKYQVSKQSGANGKILDRRTWNFDALEQAEKYFNRKVREKTRADRKSPRKYQAVDFVKSHLL